MLCAMGLKVCRKDRAGQNIPAARGETNQLTVPRVSLSGRPLQRKLVCHGSDNGSWWTSKLLFEHWGLSRCFKVLQWTFPSTHHCYYTLGSHIWSRSFSSPMFTLHQDATLSKLIPTVPRIAGHNIHGNLLQHRAQHW